MQIQLNLLVIVESLRPDEDQTGSQLYQYLQSKPLPIETELYRPATRAELFDVLERLAQRAEAGACVPIIHLEVHGSKQAVQVSSMEIISWHELSVPLRRVNLAVRNSMIVTTAVCYGAYIGTAAATHPSDPAPFCGAVGPGEEVYSDDLLAGFRAFFDELLHTGNFAVAIKALQQHNLPGFVPLDMATLFAKGYGQYASSLDGPEFEARVDELLAQLPPEEVARRGGSAKAREDIVRTLRNYRERREAKWVHFIMADLYPENRERFASLEPRD